MSIAPHSLWSERFEQIGRLIEDNTEALAERWAKRALEEQPDAQPAHRKDLRNRLPDLLRAMGRSLATAHNAVPAAHTMLALEHGEQRWQLGWRLTEVIRDYQILRLVILEYLDEILDQPLQTREVMAIGLALDEAISASVLAYVGFQEGQLRDSNRRLTDFLPVLGHELRNPLAAIVAAMDLVRACQPVAPLLTDAHDIIERQARHLSRLLNDISDVSRIMRGQLELLPATVDLRDVIQQSVEVVRPLISERDQTLQVTVADAPLQIRGDVSRLQQVLTNLLHNAAKYTDPHGHIAVDARQRDGRVVVSLRDTGVGISPEVLPHIFEMFSQAPEHKHQGLGIGLALVRALVEAQDGTVSASSSGPGQGSEFTIEFPIATLDAPLVTESSTRPPVPAGEAYRILLVDDHVDSARSLAALLARQGHQVCSALDGPSAIATAGTFLPEAVLIDIGLPGMNGYEVAQALRADERFRGCLLIAVTGYGNESDQQQAIAAGFDQHLTKPVNLEQLLDALKPSARRL